MASVAVIFRAGCARRRRVDAGNHLEAQHGVAAWQYGIDPVYIGRRDQWYIAGKEGVVGAQRYDATFQRN